MAPFTTFFAYSRDRILFPAAETFLPTFCVVTKSKSSKTKLAIIPLTTLKPVWLFRPLLNETYKPDRLQIYIQLV
jgi:hypothetical protein